jgi:hypothetical protein
MASYGIASSAEEYLRVVLAAILMSQKDLLNIKNDVLTVFALMTILIYLFFVVLYEGLVVLGVS